MHSRSSSHLARASVLTVGLTALLGSGPATAEPAATRSVTPSDTAQQRTISTTPGDVMARTELYFGTEKPGPDVSNRQFQTFLATQITPRFPDGLTVYQGYGQFRDASGRIVRERALVVVLFYPTGDIANASAKIEAIRATYKRTFQQESVLRADSADRVSF